MHFNLSWRNKKNINSFWLKSYELGLVLKYPCFVVIGSAIIFNVRFNIR